MLRLFPYICFLIIFLSCRKTISNEYHAELIGEWYSVPDSTHQIIINEDGSGVDNGRSTKNVYLKTNRDKLIFQRSFGFPRDNGIPRSTYYVKIAPTIVQDTLVFDGEFYYPGEIYMKLVVDYVGEAEFSEVFFKKK